MTEPESKPKTESRGVLGGSGGAKLNPEFVDAFSGPPVSREHAFLEELEVPLWHRLVVPAHSFHDSLTWFGKLYDDGPGVHAPLHTPSDGTGLHPWLTRHAGFASLPSRQVFFPTGIDFRHQAFPRGWWDAALDEAAITFFIGERDYHWDPGSARPIRLSRAIPITIPALQKFGVTVTFRRPVTVPREAYVDAVLTGALGREL